MVAIKKTKISANIKNKKKIQQNWLEKIDIDLASCVLISAAAGQSVDSKISSTSMTYYSYNIVQNVYENQK